MKNLFIAGCFLLVSVMSFGQTQISQEDCLVLQSIFDEQANTLLDDWEYTIGTTDYVMGSSAPAGSSPCNCANAATYPDYQDMVLWTGITLNTSSNTILELDMVNQLEEIPGALFGTDNALNDLEVLRVGGDALITSTTWPDLVTPNIRVLDGLEELWWSNDDENTDIPNLTRVGSGNLRLLWFFDLTNLGTYTTSGFNQIANLTTLTSLRLLSVSSNGNGTQWPLEDIAAGSRNGLVAFQSQATFIESTGANWYPAGFDAVWPVLTSFQFTNVSLPANTDLEPNTGDLFNAVNFPNLVTLDLQYCGFDGNMPDDVFDIASLDNLNLLGNNLQGDVLPANLTGNHGLKTYIAGDNNLALSGAAEYARFGNLTSLRTLRLDNCGLSCPISMLNLSNCPLVSINLNGNSLSGPIPDYYGSFALTQFSVQSNLLTYCPALNTTSGTLETLVMNQNFFSLDDIYRATSESECNLIERDNLNEGFYQINAQRERVLDDILTIDVTLKDIDHGTYDQTGGLFNINGTDNVSGRNSAITLSTHHVVDAIDGPAHNANAVSYTWKRDDGIAVANAEGNINGPLYLWEEPNNSYNGAMWFCELHLVENPTCAVTTDDEFYEELIMKAGRADITFNLADPCAYIGSGNQPYVEEDDNTTSESTANAKDRTGSSISSPSFTTTAHVFPNPTSGLITLESNEIIEELEVRDLSGRVMDKEHTQGHKIDYATNHLKAGTYILRFKTQSGWSTTKITKSE